MYRIGNIGRAGILAGLLGWAASIHASDAVVGPGNCNEAGFTNALSAVDNSGGGTITFNCGTATFTVTSYKSIANTVVIDGGGRITFDGGGSSAFFQVFASAQVTLRNLTLRHGVFNAVHAVENFGTLTLDRVTLAENTSSESPLMNYGSATVIDSTFSGNASASSGGAISNLGTSLDVSGSTFDGNSATNGAAIYSEAPLAVTNSTFSANTASGGGGAIYQTDAADALLVFVTAAGNTAVFGAGVYKDAGNFDHAMTVANSIFSGNATGNCDGVIESAGYNLSDDTHCGAAFTGPGDLNNVALPMQPLGDNGGPTRTQPPQAGNPAIDHVPLASCPEPFDQRGGARPFGAACDSGAVEVGSAAGDRIFADGFEA